MQIRVRNLPYCPDCQAAGKLHYENVSDRLYGVEGMWNILHCDVCDLLWLSPQPIEDDLHLLYINYHTHEKFEETHFDHGLKSEVYKYILQHHYGYFQNSAAAPLTKSLAKFTFIQDELGKKIMFLPKISPGKLLDVGAGNGKFLSFMKNLGWDVYGIEPDKDAASLAANQLGVPIFTQSIDSVELQDDIFDAITMDHVIEHLINPGKSLRTAWRLLKPGGTLAILTPNIHSFGHIKFRSDWLHLDPPRHLYLHSSKSISEAAYRAGFEVVTLRTISTSAWWVYISSNIIYRKGSIPGGSLGKKELTLLSKLRGGIFYLREENYQYRHRTQSLGAGEELLLMARKPAK